MSSGTLESRPKAPFHDGAVKLPGLPPAIRSASNALPCVAVTVCAAESSLPTVTFWPACTVGLAMGAATQGVTVLLRTARAEYVLRRRGWGDARCTVRLHVRAASCLSVVRDLAADRAAVVASADTIVPDFPLPNESFSLSFAGSDLS
ncbi:hypothetical protein ACFC8N_33860 [Streptomyces sp. NPDC055966]|uniref:hypothetical protein n=1 Tax=unclassified Streptomyces TaxID=2593676 RepID=UPI0035DC37EE